MAHRAFCYFCENPQSFVVHPSHRCPLHVYGTKTIFVCGRTNTLFEHCTREVTKQGEACLFHERSSFIVPECARFVRDSYSMFRVTDSSGDLIVYQYSKPTGFLEVYVDQEGKINRGDDQPAITLKTDSIIVSSWYIHGKRGRFDSKEPWFKNADGSFDYRRPSRVWQRANKKVRQLDYFYEGHFQGGFVYDAQGRVSSHLKYDPYVFLDRVHYWPPRYTEFPMSYDNTVFTKAIVPPFDLSS